MKGYKGMDENMQCRGFQYEVGKTYRTAGEIALCKNGFHFCERLTDVFSYCIRYDSRFFEIEANGTIYSDGRKSVSEEITIIRELSDEELNRAFYGYGNSGAIEASADSHGYNRGDSYSPGGYSLNYGDGNGDGNGNSWTQVTMNIQQILIFN